MAVATLVLGVPQKVTLEATPTNLRSVVIPRGTRALKCSSESPWFLELADPGSTSDGDPGTAGAQFRYDAGTFSDKLPGFGITPDQVLNEDKTVFVAGSVADQELWLHPVTEAG